MAVEILPCGGFYIDGDTLSLTSVKGHWVLSTAPKSEYENLEEIYCGSGFYIDTDVFKIKDNILTKKNKLFTPKKTFSLCGGLVLDAEVFKAENRVISYIG